MNFLLITRHFFKKSSAIALKSFPKMSFSNMSNNFVQFIFTYASSKVIFALGAIAFILSTWNVKHITFPLAIPTATGQSVKRSAETTTCQMNSVVFLPLNSNQAVPASFPYVSFLAGKNILHCVAVQCVVDSSVVIIRRLS